MKNYYDAFLGILSNGEVLSLSSAKFASPLGLNVLGTKIKRLLPDTFVRIYNLEVSDFNIIKTNIETVIGKHNRVLVGLTLIAGNVFKSLELAEWFKKMNCDVVIGGPEVTNLTVEHFSSLPMINGAIVGFGEHCIVEIIKDGLKQKIYAPSQYFDFTTTTVDYGLLFQLENYGGVSMLWGGDCHLHNQRCYFCSRQKRGFGWRNPAEVWAELQYPYQHYGIKKLYNTADTVAVNLIQLRRLAEAKPPEMSEIKIKCFINATQVTDETAKLLKQLNAWAAIGIETCSRIGVVGKGKTKPKDNYRAIEILARHGVPLILTFVMGLPGETKKSLSADVQNILRIVAKHKDVIDWVTVSPLLITLGSRAFEDCFRNISNLPKRHSWEFYNPLLTTEQYFKIFCSVEIEMVYKTIANLKKSISNINPGVVFDSKGLDPKKWLK